LPVCLFVCAVAAAAHSNGIAFRLSDVVVDSNASSTTGTIHAFLSLTGDSAAHPPNVSSLNVAFELNGHPGGIAFAAPLDPPANGLIPSGVPFAGATQLPHVIRFAKDSGVPTPAVDGALMVAVPFTVAAGTAPGTYPVRFISGNELGSSSAVPLPITLVDGSITVEGIGPLVTGDYNRNGVVDAADYGLWRNSMGQTGPGLAADGNGNNLIDGGDYSVWKANYGRTASSSFASGAAIPGIPEPATWHLMVVVLIALSAKLRTPCGR
jgi:hypothetical protein